MHIVHSLVYLFTGRRPGLDDKLLVFTSDLPLLGDSDGDDDDGVEAEAGTASKAVDFGVSGAKLLDRRKLDNLT